MASGMKRIPSFSGRPGFPNGLQVLVVDGDTESSVSLQHKLEEHSYEVTRCSTGSEASALLEKEGSSFDILLVEAKVLAKDATDGGSLRESASHLPLVLMSEKSSSTDDVWRGIELGAADVLEKPLSSLKLRNVWQHVVRKMMSSSSDSKQSSCKLEGGKGKGKEVSAPSSPRTPSPAASVITISSGTVLTERSCKGSDEASFSGAAALKNAFSGDLPEQHESRATADSPASTQTKASFPGSECNNGNVANLGALASGKQQQPQQCGGGSRKSRRARAPETPASVASRPPLAIRPPAWTSPCGPHPQMGGPVMGMAPPHCYMQGVDPMSGCVWGTPAMGMGQSPSYTPSWGYTAQPPTTGSFPPSSSGCELHKCPSSGASSLSSGSFDSSLTFCGFPSDGLPDDDVLLDDVLLPDEDLLDLAPDEPTMKAPETPPIGLKLTKSASLVDLINAQLAAANGGAGGCTGQTVAA